MQSPISSAGRGDPYWYEWFVGLTEVVDLLDPGTDIISVAFQVPGVKGWDDVVVRLKSGKRRCYQVKHTRAENDLKFGVLVGKTDGKPSLLEELFEAWREAKLNDGGTKCILYTNRAAGQRWSSTSDGQRRPPLVDFYAWLQEGLRSAKSIAEVIPPPNLQQAWSTWLAQFHLGSEAEQLEFLRALEIRDTEADLDGIVARVHEKLAKAFGVSQERVNPLMDTLHRALRKWTTGHPGVTVEELCSELALPPEAKERAPAPPPPTPFFPSRVPIAEELEKTLDGPSTEPVVFLTAEPGAGKTSVISWMTNRRVDVPFSGIVDARFFCFEPIRPENPVVAPDAARVHSNDLWFSLLSQIREGLRGRLHELKVPLRNSLLTWQEARVHVLRLADLLGREHGRRFILAIDGIDHAARAVQTNPQQVADFFASLPSPDELGSKNIRLFLAGQPPEYYEQYPAWLRLRNSQVRRIDLPLLSTDDVETLYSAAQVQFPLEQRTTAIRVIEENAKGNTLATVFAIDEAKRATTVEELGTKLRVRRLADGLVTYYSAIWTHMLESAGDSAAGVESCLAGAISMARRGIQPELLSSAFADWKKPTPWWRAILEALGPILSEGSDGFRVRHNDVRVFLAAQFARFSERQRQRVASQLADDFRKSESDRIAAHLQLFDLLCLAGRSEEQADVFNVDWVFEAAALGIETGQLMQECKAAIQVLARRKKWPVVVSVACAAQTLERLVESREYSAAAEDYVQAELPPFLPSEVSVRALKQWTTADFSRLVNDAQRLLQGGEPTRALGLLQRWLGGLSLSELVALFPSTIDHFGSHHDGIKPADESRIAPFGDLGAVCADLGWAIPHGEPESDIEHNAVFAFEKRYVACLPRFASVESMEKVLEPYRIHYLASWEQLLRQIANAGNWRVVRQGLALLSNHRRNLSTTAQAEATWWALRSGAFEDEPAWLEPLENAVFGISESDRRAIGTEDRDQVLRAFASIARSFGWRRMGRNPGDIGSEVYDVYQSSPHMEEHRHAGVLIFRAAVMMGRITHACETDGIEGARILVRALDVGAVLSALWSDRVLRDMHFGRQAADLAEELADACGVLGGDHDDAALNAARPYAEAFPVDFKRDAIWSVIRRAGEYELLRKWLRHWLASDGAVWILSRDQVYSITNSLAALGHGIGEDQLIQEARERRKWMLIGYQGHKEYGFQYVLDWFHESALRSPQIWKDAGWKLWSACLACEAQGGDNRIRSSILDAISAAAMRCGASSWWRLISTTMADVADEYWHSETNSRLVDGAALALLEGLSLSAAEMMNIWALAVSLSLWMDRGDNSSLRELGEAMLQSLPEASREEMRTRLQEITPRAFAKQPPAKDDDPAMRVADHESASSATIETLLKKVEDGTRITLAEAATAMQRIGGLLRPRREELIQQVFGALGTDSNYVSVWHYSESHTDLSLKSIVDSSDEEDLWVLIDVIGRELEHKASWLGVNANLHRLATARAKARGLDELSAGLEIHLNMHLSWAFGGLNSRQALPVLPESPEGLTWQDVALQLLPVLFKSYYAEVVAAAIEGMHALVAADGRVISRLFAVLNTEWSRRWLLNAAESWAALHPQELEAVRNELERLMNGSEFENRLQAWIVLCRLSDLQGVPRMHFPIPLPAASGAVSLEIRQRRILHSSPLMQGHFQLVDRHSSAISKLHRLFTCGFDFSAIEPNVADALINIGKQSLEEDDLRFSGPRRRGAMLCRSDEEGDIIGREIWSVLDADWCEQSDIVRMAQAYLNNEDAWIAMHPPYPIFEPGVWPVGEEYGSDSVEHDAVRTGLINLAMHHGIPEGWQMFSAWSTAFTWKEDYVLRLWYEQIPSSPLLRPTIRPTCPSGRTFLWWLGDCFQPESSGLFVSGLFVGGMVRLHHCNVEIMPPKALITELGWEPQVTNPLVWYHHGKPVARYERLHGPLRDNPQSVRARQPVLHRWIIKTGAFADVERCIGSVRLKEEFEIFPFKD